MSALPAGGIEGQREARRAIGREDLLGGAGGMQQDRLCLIHLNECIRRIANHTRGDRARFMDSSLIQDAVMWNLHLIGECAEKVSEPRKKMHPEINWERVAALQDIPVHEQIGLDLEQIWHVVESELPQIERNVKGVLAALAREVW